MPSAIRPPSAQTDRPPRSISLGGIKSAGTSTTRRVPRDAGRGESGIPRLASSSSSGSHAAPSSPTTAQPNRTSIIGNSQAKSAGQALQVVNEQPSPREGLPCSDYGMPSSMLPQPERRSVIRSQGKRAESESAGLNRSRISGRQSEPTEQ
jgi:hypothetical protein